MLIVLTLRMTILTLGRTSEVTPPSLYKGGGVDGTPLGFSLCYNILKRFHFSRKPVMCSTR